MSSLLTLIPTFRKEKQLNKRIWHMAWPPMLSNITTPLLGLVDTAVVGHLANESHLGAVAIGASIFSLVFWAFGFLRMGSTGLTAQALGRKDDQRVLELLLQSVLLGILIGLLLILFREPIIDVMLWMMSPSAQVEPWARLYCEVRILSAPAVLAGYAVVGWFYGVQNARGPLWIMLLINVVNMVLDYYAVYHLDMASDGVAWATVFSQYAGLALALYLASKQLKKLNINISSEVAKSLLKFSEYIALIQVNRYLFVRTILLLAVGIFFTAQGSAQGDNILAANAVLLTFLMIISNALDGFAFSVEALCGEAIGQKDKTQFEKVVLLSSVWALVAAVGLVCVFWLFGNHIVSLLTSIESVKSIAAIYLPWLIIFPLLGVWSFMLDGVFIGATEVKQMQDAMIVSVVLVFFPCWYITQQLGMGNHGLWLSQAALFVARGASMYWLYRRNLAQGKWFVDN
ncbi:MATE family efflux transporter [Marinomonas sp. S3726]|uniref:MATE family efflux transporter n=1 Tax=Marinomonas sp. S3726 TaxID=579484 RepID=UPI0005FA28C4|nr:MATE family efflux transporter [Marinomonas sp. S3726]